ncbi:MAG: WD40 repeat domain-containing protein [Hyphomicrobiales bacterium]|nr:WD40 repeat domain-containing protein [Hyphomicrobiales bacterium]
MSATSLSDHVIPIEAGAEIVGAAFLQRTPALALADGVVLLADVGEERRIVAHEDAAILASAANGRVLLTGGDDGRVVATDASGAVTQFGDEKGKWIDALALRADGAALWSAGKRVAAREASGAIKHWDAPSSVRGLAFFPKGYRVAAAHYNGASLWFPNAGAAPEFLEWKGSHLDVTVSPDGRFLVTSMQENMLHGWRLADKKHMRMSGYPAKPRSLSWSHDGYWLATSGAEACIVWPFQTKDGPMGKAPRECGVRDKRVSCVAFHPTTLIAAIGYEDGWLMLCRLLDGAEIFVRGPKEGKAISALAWDAPGKRLLFGAKDGVAGLLQLP